MKLRIGLLGLADSPVTGTLIAELHAAGVRPDVIFLSKPTFRQNIARVARKLRAAGVGPTLSRVSSALSRRANLAAGREPKIEVMPATQTHIVGSFNDPTTRDLIRSKNIDVLLSATDEILRRATFSIPRFGTLNAHPGWAPKYRGLGSVARMIRDGLKPAVSVHLIDEGIDTGPIFYREKFEIEDDIDTSVQRAQAAGFARVINQIEAGDLMPIDTFTEPSNLSRR